MMMCVIVIEALCWIVSTHTIHITTNAHLVIKGVIQRRSRVGLIVHSQKDLVFHAHYVIYLFLACPLGSIRTLILRWQQHFDRRSLAELPCLSRDNLQRTKKNLLLNRLLLHLDLFLLFVLCGLTLSTLMPSFTSHTYIPTRLSASAPSPRSTSSAYGRLSATAVSVCTPPINCPPRPSLPCHSLLSTFSHTLLSQCKPHPPGIAARSPTTLATVGLKVIVQSSSSATCGSLELHRPHPWPHPHSHLAFTPSPLSETSMQASKSVKTLHMLCPWFAFSFSSMSPRQWSSATTQLCQLQPRHVPPRRLPYTLSTHPHYPPVTSYASQILLTECLNGRSRSSCYDRF
jgi:hypothetical protein